MTNTVVMPKIEEETRPDILKSMGTKAYFLFTFNGPMVILTSCSSIDDPECLKILRSKGFHKFIAHEIPVALASARYGTHFNVVCNGLHENDALRILDFRSERAINLFSFREFGPPVYYE